LYACRTDTDKALYLYIAGQRGAATESSRIAVSVIMHAMVSGPTPVMVARERRTVIGTPQVVKDGIEALAAEHGEEEALIVNIVYDHSAASGRIN
jgi:alkanesulfonate monooxygenase SsuD/methylene tetrahydromethanopterin reductase-like flavin-dependent oxidoreductase (luciferase family)